MPPGKLKLSMMKDAEAVSGSDGSFLVELRPGTYSAVVSLAQYVDCALSTFSVDEGTSVAAALARVRYNVVGRVTDAESSEVVFDALVVQNDTTGTKELRTSDDGTFTLSAMLPGQYRLAVSAQGFLPTTAAFEVGEADISVTQAVE